MRIAFDHIDVSFPVDAARMLPRRVDGLAVDLLVGAGQDQIAGGVEYHHRLDAAIEHVDAILRVDRQAGDAGLIPRTAGLPPAASALPPTCAPCGRLRLAFSWRRRRILEPEIHAGRQLRPVRHELVPAIALRGTLRHEERKDRKDRKDSFHAGYPLLP